MRLAQLRGAVSPLKASFFLGALVGLGAVVASCHTDDTPTYLSRDQMLDPASCSGCHATHYEDWSGSMHAYASDDPIFLAMNARGQRETKGALGSFCVNCHAPMAVREKATTDGTNLASVPQKLKGVGCYFCHTIDSVSDTHNASVNLTGDTEMLGPIKDPFANTAHTSKYLAADDRDNLSSAQPCGTCHDVTNGHGAAIERTLSEWQSTVFAQPEIGDTCSQCHMNQSTSLVKVASVEGAPLRRYHLHSLPAVDTALTTFPHAEDQKQQIQDLLDSSVQSAICVADGTFGIDVIVDNVAAGHDLPSGAAQDRRMWAEVIGYSADQVVYSSGVVPDGTAVTKIADPDLWLMRECMLDDKQSPVSMFWNASSYESTQLPGPATLDSLDPRFYQTHIFRSFPRAGDPPGTLPDRVTLRLRIQPVGLDVLDDLIESGDLDPSYKAKMPTFDLGTTVEWTAAKATFGYTENGVAYNCVTDTNLNFQSDKFAAPAPAHCIP